MIAVALLNGIAQAEDLQSLSQDPKNWPMAPRDYASTRFSPLDQINAGNAGQLKLAWSFSLGVDRGQEAAPIVVDGTMYVVSPFPNKVFALDAATGQLKWTYIPGTDPASQGVACCDVINRGAAYDNGKIFFNTLDMHTIALDAATGKELWVAKLGDINKGETMTMAPLVVKGKVLVGNSGGEMGVHGWVTALDENSGATVWRAYGTGSDKDVLIGPEFKPFYAQYKGKDLGISSWPSDAWKIGGGTMWGWISYDPDLNEIIYGTGNPGPWNSTQRPGDNLWTTTMFARNPDTGAALWAYQETPHDLWDYDDINESILLDLPINGQTRKIALHPGRNGFMYVIDRTSGEVLSADAYDYVNTATGIDLKTGYPILNNALTPELNKTIKNVCPAAPGAKDWMPTAYSPRTKLLYVPHQHLCMDFQVGEVGYIAGTPYMGATVDMYAGPGHYRGEFMAWDPVARKRVWAIHENFPVWTGTLVTAGDVTFYGTMDRWFKALDARDGKILWQFEGPSGFIGQPTTFEGKDGVQYVAILSGVGGWPGAIANAGLDPRMRNGALGFMGAMQDLPMYTQGGSSLLVFALEGKGSAAHANPNPEPAKDLPVQ